jgi:hypothetical protein
MFDMRRREFIAMLGGATAAWPVSAHAQQPMPVVGFLHARSAAASTSQMIAFRAGLNENGFVDGSNVIVDVRWAEGHYDRLVPLMTDLKQKPLSIVATGGGPAAAFGDSASSFDLAYARRGSLSRNHASFMAARRGAFQPTPRCRRPKNKTPRQRGFAGRRTGQRGSGDRGCRRNAPSDL